MQASRPQFRSSVSAVSDLYLYCSDQKPPHRFSWHRNLLCSLLCWNFIFPPRITPCSYSALRPFLFAGASFEWWQNWQMKSSALPANLTKKDDHQGAAARYMGETPSPPQVMRILLPSHSRQGFFTDNRNSANDKTVICLDQKQKLPQNFFFRKLQFTQYDFIIIYIVNCRFLLAGLFCATEMLSFVTAFLNQTSWKLAHKTLAIIYKQKDWQEGVLCERYLIEELAPHSELK